VNKRLDLAFDDIGRIKEYTKLLHSLSHNVVVEMTKLKIEEENLKIKARILEKDFEFLGKREKALEDQVLK
jgi:NADH/NAD ratio-sensing transcriptional regulator Rex